MILWIIALVIPVSNTMTLDYETVHYSRGTVGKAGPKGFAKNIMIKHQALYH